LHGNERSIVGSALLATFMSSAATPLMTATTTMALDLYRKARPSSVVPELMRTSRFGAVTIGLAALALALTGSGIIAMLFSIYPVFASGMLVPVIAGFYKEKLGLTSMGALTALVGGGLTVILLGKSYPLLGLAVSAVLPDLCQLDRPQARKGWTCYYRLIWRVLGILSGLAR
jgi:SSS family solute:Na+ symporter